jgi:hypothetical protein
MTSSELEQTIRERKEALEAKETAESEIGRNESALSFPCEKMLETRHLPL